MVPVPMEPHAPVFDQIFQGKTREKFKKNGGAQKTTHGVAMGL